MFFVVVVVVAAKEALSVSMLYVPNNCGWPFSCHTKMVDFWWYFHALAVFSCKRMA